MELKLSDQAEKVRKITLEEIAKKQEELQEIMRQEGKRLFQQYFQETFDEFPELIAVAWDQYTPYFNDGDECVFGIHGVYYLHNIKPEDMAPEYQYRDYDFPLKDWDGENLEEYLYENGLDSKYEWIEAGYSFKWYDKLANGYNDYKNPNFAHPLAKKMSEFSGILEKHEEMLKTAFGDHTTVYIDRKGMTVEECEHD